LKGIGYIIGECRLIQENARKDAMGKSGDLDQEAPRIRERKKAGVPREEPPGRKEMER
jgi:hypothetical protein